MEKFYKRFMIFNIIIWLAVAAFFVLQFYYDIFIYFMLVGAVIGFVLLATYQVFKYKDLKEKIKQGYDVYLVDYFREGFITKEQFLNKAPELYPEYCKLFRKEKLARIGMFLVYFAFALAIVTYLIKTYF